MTVGPRFPGWMGQRAVQAISVLLVLLGVRNLWASIGEASGWFAVLGAFGQLFLFVAMFAFTVAARRQNRPDHRR